MIKAKSLPFLCLYFREPTQKEAVVHIKCVLPFPICKTFEKSNFFRLLTFNRDALYRVDEVRVMFRFASGARGSSLLENVSNVSGAKTVTHPAGAWAFPRC
jgi:hypothetical protein